MTKTQARTSTRSCRRRLAVLGASLLMTSSTLLATTTAEAAPVLSAVKANAPAEGDNLDPATAACAAAATDRDLKAWTCMGPQLTYETTTPSKKMANGKKRAKKVVHTELVKSALRASRAQAAAAAADPGDDGWCENGSKCTSRISKYISHTKGNAAYGDSDGVIGSFDVNLRSNLNGRSPRVRGQFDYDSGPRIVFHNTQIQVIEDQLGPNPVARAEYVDGPDGNGSFAIGPNDEVDRGPLINFKPLADANDYWNQIKGRFEVPNRMDFTLGTLKSAKYHCQTGEECYFPNE
jgi:hypothetical protein